MRTIQGSKTQNADQSGRANKSNHRGQSCKRLQSDQVKEQLNQIKRQHTFKKA